MIDRHPNPLLTERRSRADHLQRLALVLLVALPAIAAAAHGGVEPWAHCLLLGGVLLVLWSTLATHLRAADIELSRGRVELPLLALVLVSGCSLAWSLLPWASRLELHVVLIVAAYLVAALHLLRDGDSCARAAWGVALFGGCLALLGLIIPGGEIAGIRIFSPQRRIALTFANPDHFASFLAMVACVASGLTVASTGWRRAAAALVSLTTVVAVVLTASRGGALALIIGLGTLLGLLWHRSRSGAALALVAGPPAVAFAAAWLADAASLGRLATLADPARLSPDRLETWKATLVMIADRPILGSGLGTFRWVFPRFQTEALTHSVINHAHNDSLELVAELGLLGLASGGWLLAAVVATALRGLLRQTHDGLRAIGLGAAAGCLTLAVHSLVEFNLQIPANATLCALCAAIAIGCGSESLQRVRLALQPAWRRWAMIAGLAVVSLAGLTELTSTAAANRLFDEARRHRVSGRYGPAADLLERASRIAPGDPSLYAERAELERTQALASPAGAARRPRLIAALRAASRAADLAPTRADLWARTASIQRLLGRLHEAEETLRHAIALAPTRALSHLEVGQLYLEMGRDRDADRHLRRAVELDPRLLMTVAHSLLESSGGSTVDRLAAVIPPRANLHDILGRRLLAQSRFSEAVSEFELAYRMQPQAERAAAHVTALVRSQRLGEAAHAVSNYLERHPDDPSVLRRAIEVDLKLGQLEAAAELARRLVELEPDNPSRFLALARILRRQGACESGRQALEEGIRHAPEDVRFQVELALLHRQCGSDGRALEALHEAIRIAPGDPRYRVLLAEHLSRLGLDERAREEYRACLDLDPDYAPCQQGLLASGK